MFDIDALKAEEKGELIKQLFANELKALTQETNQEKIETLQDNIAALSAVIHRRNLAAVLGDSFGGDRDLYDALGYTKDPTAEDYEAKYRRNEVAGRIVDLPANASWKKPPAIVDGKEAKKEKSEFVNGLDWLAQNKNLWPIMNEFDRKIGIGSFGILLIGVEKSGKLSTPLTPKRGGGMGYKLISYIRPFSHMSVKQIEYDENEESPRFGFPEYYKIDFGQIGDRSLGERRIHYSRIIHAAENAPSGEVFGRSRLERPLNRLEDLERVIGASSESVWRLAIKGAVIEGNPDYKGFDLIADALKEKTERLIHGLDRTLVLDGATYKQLGGEMVDPSGLFGALGTLLAAGGDIPKRILFGTEEAQLAGSQDQANWAAQIETRRSNFVNPSIIRPFLDWCEKYGILPAPADGTYTITWQSNFEATDEQKATTLQANAAAMQTAFYILVAGGPITAEEVRMFGMLPEMPTLGTIKGLVANKNLAKIIKATLTAALEARRIAQATTATYTNGNGRLAAHVIPNVPTEDDPPTDEEILQAIKDWDRDFPELAQLLAADYDAGE